MPTLSHLKVFSVQRAYFERFISEFVLSKASVGHFEAQVSGIGRNG